jgi:hypothetical protein
MTLRGGLTSFAVLLVGTSLFADAYVDSKSPDKKFALRVTREDQQPYRQSAALVEVKTRKVILNLDTNQVFDPEAKLAWSSDSQWVAYVTRIDEEMGSVTTRVFVRNGSAFNEIKLPELPAPKVSSQAPSSEKRATRIKPARWSKSGSLDLEYEIITESGRRGATKFAVQFDRQQPASIGKAELETMSVSDYYLLLPDKTLETAPRHWLQNATVIDKQNGYLSISGDGAQPSFQAALFRYRDGRPLLALCEGELEGDDSKTLEFFELGADGRMNKVSRKIFPVGDAWSEGSDEPQPQSWYFELPRHDRTVLVRSLKTKIILHRVTWNGERFVEKRDAPPSKQK